MPQTPSSDAGSEAGGPDLRAGWIDPLLEAAQLLAKAGALGVAWLDADLTVIAVAGPAVDGLKIGARATDTFLPLVGLDADLETLRMTGGHAPLRLANTAVIGGDGRQSQRHDIAVFWDDDGQRFLLHLSRVDQQSAPSAEIDQEIRRRRLFEQDLAAKSLEYARINEQLDQFAYVISHDLNAPLRALRYLSGEIRDLLERSQGGSDLDRDGLIAASEALTAQTRRMSRMLTDLLDYARVGRVQEAVVAVDTRSVVTDIFQSLRPSTRLELALSGGWPTIDTLAAPLDLVLRNLVENAIKHHDCDAGRIEVNASFDARHVFFSIIDDGRGIAPEWQSAIFEPFRKIDDAHHPESSGIGLALVKKTVETVGGNIQVQSDPATRRGTTFVVQWPREIAVRIGD